MERLQFLNWAWQLLFPSEYETGYWLWYILSKGTFNGKNKDPRCCFRWTTETQAKHISVAKDHSFKDICAFWTSELKIVRSRICYKVGLVWAWRKEYNSPPPSAPSLPSAPIHSRVRMICSSWLGIERYLQYSVLKKRKYSLSAYIFISKNFLV